MACGCGGGNRNVRASRNTIAAPSAVVKPANVQSPTERILQEKKVVESRRREKLLRALKVP